MEKRYGNQNKHYNEKKEGEIHVSKPPKKNKIVDNDVGDYIDYEEVDD